MNSYILAIIAISIVGGFVSNLIPPKNIRLKKYLNFIISLIFLTIMISPIKNVIDKASILKENVDSFISSISSNVDYTNNLIIHTSIDKISLGIKEAILNEFKFQSDDIEIMIYYNEDYTEAIEINMIEIYLYDSATWIDEKKIKDFTEGLISCDVTIIKNRSLYENK